MVKITKFRFKDLTDAQLIDELRIIIHSESKYSRKLTDLICEYFNQGVTRSGRIIQKLEDERVKGMEANLE